MREGEKKEEKKDFIHIYIVRFVLVIQKAYRIGMKFLYLNTDLILHREVSEFCLEI